MPGVRRATEAAWQAACASQLRQITQAFTAYATVNQSWMCTSSGNGVTSRNWVFWQTGRDINQSALAPYLAVRDDRLRDLFRCPATPPENQMGFRGGSPFPLTFSMNGFLEPKHDGEVLFQNVRNPSGKILLYDENENSDDDHFWWGTDRDTLAGRHGSRSTQVANINGVGTRTTSRQMGNVSFF